MDQSWINIGAGVALSVMGWFARQLWQAVQDLKSDIKRIEIDLPTRYVTRPDHSAAMAEIRDSLRRIEDKIDHKADK